MSAYMLPTGHLQRLAVLGHLATGRPSSSCFKLLARANRKSLRARYGASAERLIESAAHPPQDSVEVLKALASAPDGALLHLAMDADYQMCEFPGWGGSSARQLLLEIFWMVGRSNSWRGKLPPAVGALPIVQNRLHRA